MADNSTCSACVNAQRQGVTLDPEAYTNTFYAELLDVSEATIRRHWKHGDTIKVGLLGVVTPTPNSIKEAVEQSSTGSRSVTGYAAVRDRPVTLEDAREWIRSSGDDPDDYIINVKALAYGDNLFSNGMWARPAPKAGIIEEVALEDIIDPVAILKELRVAGSAFYKDDTTPRTWTGEGALVISLNDTQLGKAEGGGTAVTIERIHRYIMMVADRLAELRAMGRDIGKLVIIGGGDIVEGCTIYPNQSYSLDLDRRGQINAAVTLILHTIDTLAPLFEEVYILATRGNHGEHRIGGNRTTLYDNDDTLVFEMARNATERDERLQHVQYVIAQEEAGVYLDIAGWRLATTHGDIYGKHIAGATQDKKAQNWYKNMAMGRDPLGQADVLITHHFHHDKMSDWGACLWRQTPAQDGGSEYFRQTSGEYSEAGMLTFVMTPDSRYSDEAVLR